MFMLFARYENSLEVKPWPLILNAALSKWDYSKKSGYTMRRREDTDLHLPKEETNIYLWGKAYMYFSSFYLLPICEVTVTIIDGSSGNWVSCARSQS